MKWIIFTSKVKLAMKFVKPRFATGAAVKCGQLLSFWIKDRYLVLKAIVNNHKCLCIILSSKARLDVKMPKSRIHLLLDHTYLTLTSLRLMATVKWSSGFYGKNNK